MGEEFTQQFKELFQCTAIGKDIAEGRFNAWTALEQALGEAIHQKHHWKLSAMQHGIGARPNPEFGKELDGGVIDKREEIPCVITEAVWVFDADAEDNDGGKGALLLLPNSPDSSRGIENPTEKSLAGN